MIWLVCINQSNWSTNQIDSPIPFNQSNNLTDWNQPIKSVWHIGFSILSNQMTSLISVDKSYYLIDSKLTNQITSQIFPTLRTCGMTTLSRFTFDGTKPTTIDVTYFKSCIKIMLSSLGNLLTTARIKLPGIRGSYSFGEYIESNFWTYKMIE